MSELKIVGRTRACLLIDAVIPVKWSRPIFKNLDYLHTANVAADAALKSYDVSADILLVNPDHIRIYGRFPVERSIAAVIHNVGRDVASELRTKHPELKGRLPSIFTRDFLLRSAGVQLEDDEVESFIRSLRRSALGQ